MTDMPILQDLVLIFGVSVAWLLIGYRVKLPPIVGFLLAGFVIGPYGLGMIRSSHEVEVLAEIGVVLLLFAVGMEFSLSDLMRSRKAVMLGGTLQVALTTVITLLLTRQFGMGWNQAVFAGFLVSLSSTAIVLKTMQERAEVDSAHGRVILSVLIFQDIAIAPMMIFTPLLAGTSGGLTESILILGLKGIAVVLAVIMLARFIVPKVLFQVTRTRSRELFLLTIVLICSAVAWGTSALGLSLGLGAFLAGLIISESEYSYQALEGILPFKTVFTGFFFVSIGMLLDTSFVLAQPVAVLGAGAAVLLLKAMIAGGVALGLGMSTRAAVIVGLALSQIGEFSFVLSRVGVSSGLLDVPSYHMFLALAVLTMGVTPFVMDMAPRLAGVVSMWPGLRRFESGSYRGMAERSSKTELLHDHLVIVGFGVNGRNIAKAAKVAGVSYEIIEMNPDTVRAVRVEGEPIRYGDATSRELLKSLAVDQARIVVIAISDPAASRQIIHTIRELSRKVYIIVRTRFVSEMRALYDLGANEVIPEEFETSVEIFTRVLLKYLVPRAEIEKFTNELRAHSYEMFRSLSRVSPSLNDLPIRLSGIEVSAVRVSEQCPISGQTLMDAQLRTRFGVNVLAVVREERLIANPAGTERITPGDVLYVIGTATQCAEANRVLG